MYINLLLKAISRLTLVLSLSPSMWCHLTCRHLTTISLIARAKKFVFRLFSFLFVHTYIRQAAAQQQPLRANIQMSDAHEVWAIWAWRLHASAGINFRILLFELALGFSHFTHSQGAHRRRRTLTYWCAVSHRKTCRQTPVQSHMHSENNTQNLNLMKFIFYGKVSYGNHMALSVCLAYKMSPICIPICAPCFLEYKNRVLPFPGLIRFIPFSHATSAVLPLFRLTFFLGGNFVFMNKHLSLVFRRTPDLFFQRYARRLMFWLWWHTVYDNSSAFICSQTHARIRDTQKCEYGVIADLLLFLISTLTNGFFIFVLIFVRNYNHATQTSRTWRAQITHILRIC